MHNRVSEKKIIIKHIIFDTILIYVIVNSRKNMYIYINSCKNDGSRIIVRQSLVTKLVVALGYNLAE